MAKRPTPKKRRAKSKGRGQYSVYVGKRVRKLRNRMNSPYAMLVSASKKGEKGLEGITRIKA